MDGDTIKYEKRCPIGLGSNMIMHWCRFMSLCITIKSR